MDNQTPIQPSGPSITPVPNIPAVTPATAPPQKPPVPAKSAMPLPKDQTKSNKKLVLGCLTAFGCSIVLFIGALFAFLMFGSETSPLFGRLGVGAGEVINVLITLVNLIFLVLVFAAFVFVVIGIFKIATAKKDDKEARRKGTFLTIGSLGILLLLIFFWVFAYFFLSQKRTVAPKIAIATTPEKTINLTAPVVIKFDASKAPVNKKQFEILTYSWDFADGTTLSGNPQTHTFTKLGNFKVKLTITAKEKATGKAQEIIFTKDVTIQNVLANVIIKADKTKGPIPLEVNFDGGASNSPNGEITAWAWDIDADGEFDDGTTPTIKSSFDKIGKYKVSLRVQDSTGAFAINNLEIETTISDTPVAVITVEGISGTTLELNKAYIFSGTASTSPFGKIEKYEWEFGDNTKAQTRTATHAFKTPGEYEIILKIIDSNKKTAEIPKRFTVKAPEAAPLISLKTTPAGENGVITGQAPFEVIFDASGSQDPNGNIVEYQWDFNGDSKTDDTNPTTSYTFQTQGTFKITLTVIDSENLSTKSQIVVKVEPAGLKADIGADPIAGSTPLTVKFDASGSSYAQGKIVSYEWDFGDGTEARIDTAKVTHQYTAIGTFTAKVTAITSDNKRATDQLFISVRPVGLKACFETNVSSGKAPLEIQFDPTCSTGTVVKYRWNFANLSKSTDRKPKFTFKDPGEYTVTLEVADNQNVVDSFIQKITIEKSL